MRHTSKRQRKRRRSSSASGKKALRKASCRHRQEAFLFRETGETGGRFWRQGDGSFAFCFQGSPGPSKQKTKEPSPCLQNRPPVSPQNRPLSPVCSVMEQPEAGEAHHHAVLVRCFDNVIIPYGAAGLNDVFYTALFRSLHVIPKGEESV